MSGGESLAGRIVLAMPGMFDPNFERSAIAMYVHDEGGALGIGIGHLRAGIGFHEVLQEVGIDPGLAPDCPVHHGGPVEPGRGFVLHSPDWLEEDSILTEPLGAISGSMNILKAIAAGEGPERWLFALGYAGWGPGQLDDEMSRHGWYVAQGRPELLFEVPAEQRWRATWDAEGIDPALLSTTTGNA